MFPHLQVNFFFGKNPPYIQFIFIKVNFIINRSVFPTDCPPKRVLRMRSPHTKDIRLDHSLSLWRSDIESTRVKWQTNKNVYRHLSFVCKYLESKLENTLRWAFEKIVKAMVRSKKNASFVIVVVIIATHPRLVCCYLVIYKILGSLRENKYFRWGLLNVSNKTVRSYSALLLRRTKNRWSNKCKSKKQVHLRVNLGTHRCYLLISNYKTHLDM